MNDPEFGHLVRDSKDLWVGSCDIEHFDQFWRIIVNVIFDEAQGIEQTQRQAHRLFTANAAGIARIAEVEIETYAISNGVAKSRIIEAVKPIAINFPDVQHLPTFGFLYETSWNPGHGAAVKFVNGEVAEVGLQDIIL